MCRANHTDSPARLAHVTVRSHIFEAGPHGWIRIVLILRAVGYRITTRIQTLNAR